MLSSPFDTTSAASVGELTLAVIIGLSRFASPDLRTLPSAAPESAALRDALTDPKGCQVPPANVTFLADATATREAILAALLAGCQRASPSHSLFIYYAGHGADTDDGFALAAHGTIPAHFASTGITSLDIEQALKRTMARGVLLVLDCCGGAALAERAPDVFRTLGRSSDYRILLSSARTGQSSWEGPKGSAFSRAFADVLAGQARSTDTAGAIYFSDLYRYLHDRVSIEMEALGDEGMAQEPTAHASYVRDPLLFLHTRLTLDQVKVRIQRYSKKDLQQLLFKWLGASALALAASLLALWVYLAGLNFLVVEEDVVALYRGHPTLRVLNYPRLVWQYDIYTDDLDASSPLAAGDKVLSHWAQDFRNEVERHLSPLGRARRRASTANPQSARPDIDQLLANPADTAGWKKGALLAIAVATPADSDRLAVFAETGPPDVAAPALSRLLQLAPQRAADLAKRLGFGPRTRGIHLQVMSELMKGCPPGVQTYLDDFTGEESNGQFARLSIAAALRTECRLSLGAIAAMKQPVYLESVARYLEIADPKSAIQLRELFAKTLDAHLGGTPVAMSLEAAVGYLVGASPTPHCPTVESFAALSPVTTQLNATRAIIRQCPSANLHLTARPHMASFRLELEVAGRSQPLLALDIPYAEGVATLWPILDALRLGGRLPPTTATVVEQLARGHPDPSVQRLAVRLLRLAQIPAKADLAAYETKGDQGLQLEAYLWTAQQHRASALTRIQQRLSDDTADFLPIVLAGLSLSATERRTLLAAAQSAKVSSRRQAMLTAILGDPVAIVPHLVNSSAKHRSWTFDYLGYRDELQDIAARIPTSAWAPHAMAPALLRLRDERASLATEIGANSAEIQNWRARLILDLRHIQNAGLRLWLRNHCPGCD